MALIYLTSDGKIIQNSSGKIYLESSSSGATIPISGGSIATADGDMFTLHASSDEIWFELDSGRETSAFYKWGGQSQQTGFNSIYNYSDLLAYEGSELWVYESDYDVSSHDGSVEQYFISHNISPIIVIKLTGSVWVQIA